jgi:hypothetical protein
MCKNIKFGTNPINYPKIKPSPPKNNPFFPKNKIFPLENNPFLPENKVSSS